MKRVFCATTILCLVAACHGTSDPNFAGTIESIHCRAELMQRSSEKAVRLDPKRDILRSLFSGDSVRCTATGEMNLFIFGRAVKINQPGVFYLIPYVAPTSLTEEEQMRRSALDEGFRRGGRERSGEEPEGESVTPQFFYIVVPLNQPQQLLVSMRDDSGKEIWHDTVSSSTGFLDSAAAREAVSHYQLGGGGVLTVLFQQNDKPERVQYFVLSSDTETKLESALKAWNGEPSKLMRHIGRASVFSQAWLFESAGQEYEEALKAAPENADLRRAAVDEYQRAGDEKGANRVVTKSTSKPR